MGKTGGSEKVSFSRVALHVIIVSTTRDYFKGEEKGKKHQLGPKKQVSTIPCEMSLEAWSVV